MFAPQQPVHFEVGSDWASYTLRCWTEGPAGTRQEVTAEQASAILGGPISSLLGGHGNLQPPHPNGPLLHPSIPADERARITAEYRQAAAELQTLVEGIMADPHRPPE